MPRTSAVQAIHDAPLATSGMTRREMIWKLLASMGAGFAWTQGGAPHPIHKHLANARAWSQPEAKAAAAAWTPLFLNARQNRTFIVLAERILPGSGKAHVNRFIDLLLSVDPHENQQRFVDSLSAFDRESVRRFGHPFRAVTEVRQNQILSACSMESIGRTENKDDSPKSRSQQTLHAHFDNLKGWIIGAYYSSEVGMRELGWTGDFVFDSFPGCQHPEGHR